MQTNQRINISNQLLLILNVSEAISDQSDFIWERTSKLSKNYSKKFLKNSEKYNP